MSLLISEEVVDKTNDDNNEILNTSGGFGNVSVYSN